MLAALAAKSVVPVTIMGGNRAGEENFGEEERLLDQVLFRNPYA